MSHKAQDVPAVAALIEKATSGLKDSSTKEGILANIRYNVDKMKKADVFQDLIKQGKLDIVGGYYHFVTGEVEFLK
jgi:hypothetical protein